MSKNSGYLVTTKTGKKGRTYHNEKPLNGKIKVHVINDEWELTGEKLLCSPEGLIRNGFID